MSIQYTIDVPSLQLLYIMYINIILKSVHLFCHQNSLQVLYYLIISRIYKLYLKTQWTSKWKCCVFTHSISSFPRQMKKQFVSHLIHMYPLRKSGTSCWVCFFKFWLQNSFANPCVLGSFWSLFATLRLRRQILEKACISQQKRQCSSDNLIYISLVVLLLRIWLPSSRLNYLTIKMVSSDNVL